MAAAESSIPVDRPACPFRGAEADVDPFSDRYLADPYRILARARSERPVFHSPDLGCYVVTRNRDIREVFRDTTRFSAANALEPVTALYPSSVARGREIWAEMSAVLVTEDGPRHRVRRKAIGETFSPRRVAELEPRIRAIVAGRLDGFVRRGRADLVADLVWDVPALVIFLVLGVPDDEAAVVKGFATSRTLLTWGRPTETEQNRLVDEMVDYWRFSCRHVDRVLEDPGDHVLGDLVRVHRERPDLIGVSDLRSAVLAFLYAGHETTTCAAGNAVRVLLENRTAWERLGTDPSLIPNAVEEVLRHSSSVISWRRRALVDTRIGGVDVPAGADILLMTGSGNRDDEAFTEPDRLDVERAGARRHLAFGFGTHTCLGAPLARLEMRVILEELTARLPHLRLVSGQEFTYSPNTTFRGPARVLVEWEPEHNPRVADRP